MGAIERRGGMLQVKLNLKVIEGWIEERMARPKIDPLSRECFLFYVKCRPMYNL